LVTAQISDAWSRSPAMKDLPVIDSWYSPDGS
jgi:hypothetical protein